MNMLDKNTASGKILLISMGFALLIIYPNIACLPWDLNHLPKSEHAVYISFFLFRFAYFSLLTWILLLYNLRKTETAVLKRRLFLTLRYTIIGYLIYIGISFLCCTHVDCFTGLLLFQYLVLCLLSALTGHLSYMYIVQRQKEQEIERLKIENLQSRCTALTNQINPHFFFNSLNGLTSLIRKKNEENTLEYVNKLSDVFRYILQSDKKGLVTLEEELDFVQAFRYMMEVRFANKLSFRIEVDKNKMNLRIPVLSILPLIDNVVVHNIIDSEHKMEVKIWINDQQELVVSNPVFPKLEAPNTNGTGLINLENRFNLLMNRKIRHETDGTHFYVYLPLKKD